MRTSAAASRDDSPEQAQAPKQAPEVWSAELASAFGLAARGVLPTGSLRSAPLGRATTFRVAGAPQSLHHERPDGDALKVCLQRRGRAIVRQGDRDVEIGPGELVVYDTARPYAIRFAGEWESAVLTAPRAGLRLRADEERGLLLQPIAVDGGPASVLGHLLADSLRDPVATVADPASQERLGRIGEAGMALLASLVTVPVTSDDDAMRERVLAFVRARLADPGLGHAQVAHEHGMSPRTLNRLFEGHPSVTDTIRELRLLGLRDDLTNPAHARRTVMALAGRWGFVDQAHVTRAFRARFGVTPGGYRRQEA